LASYELWCFLATFQQQKIFKGLLKNQFMLTPVHWYKKVLFSLTNYEFFFSNQNEESYFFAFYKNLR